MLYQLGAALPIEWQGQVDVFLKRSYRFGFTRRLFTFAQVAERADRTLFASSTANPNNCIHQLLPPARSEHIHLRGTVEAIPTHCLLLCLICLRTVLLTDAYLVIFSFSIFYFMYRVSCHVFTFIVHCMRLSCSIKLPGILYLTLLYILLLFHYIIIIIIINIIIISFYEHVQIWVRAISNRNCLNCSLRL